MIPSASRRLVPSINRTPTPLPRAAATDALALPRSRLVMARIKPPGVGDRVGQHVRRVRARFPPSVRRRRRGCRSRPPRSRSPSGRHLTVMAGRSSRSPRARRCLLVRSRSCSSRGVRGLPQARVHVDLELLFEQRQGSGGKPAGDENGGAHRHILGRNRAVPQAAACDRRS